MRPAPIMPTAAASPTPPVHIDLQTHISPDASPDQIDSIFANTPILKINAGESTSERDEQIGYMQIFSGCMTGIRNPRAHECDWEDSEQRALQLLVWANHLVERIRLSEKAQ